MQQQQPEPDPALKRLELIGYDPTSDTSLDGGANMTGKISKDGNTFSGDWRPNPGKESQGNIAYDFVGFRIK